MTMTCHDLAERIERLQPGASVRDVARLCLLLANQAYHMEGIEDDSSLADAWRDMSIRLQAATDQHAAMTEELESLARSSPRDFDMEQVWILLRAIRVQSQILQLYVGQARVDA